MVETLVPSHLEEYVFEFQLYDQQVQTNAK